MVYPGCFYIWGYIETHKNKQMKKTVIIALALILSYPIQTQACSICGPVERALKFMKNWIESSHCLTMRARIAQLRGGTIPPCDHNPKHDNAGSTNDK